MPIGGRERVGLDTSLRHVTGCRGVGEAHPLVVAARECELTQDFGRDGLAGADARGLHGVRQCGDAAAQGSGPDQYVMTSYYRDDLTTLPELGVVARQLWAQSGIGPADLDVAVLYDHFTPFVLPQLEELGFCGRGEAKDFIKNGNIEIGGDLPINTHGGQLGEAYLHGMNGVAEAVRQVRGTSVNQIPRVEHVLVTGGTGVPTSGLIVGQDR